MSDDEAIWYVEMNGQQMGPAPRSTIVWGAQIGQVRSDTQVKCPARGISVWTPIHQIPEFAGLVAAQPVMSAPAAGPGSSVPTPGGGTASVHPSPLGVTLAKGVGAPPPLPGSGVRSTSQPPPLPPAGRAPASGSAAPPPLPASRATASPPPLSGAGASEERLRIKFRLVGASNPAVEVALEPNECLVVEASLLMALEDGIDMRTVFGGAAPPVQIVPLIHALVGRDKALLTHESLYFTVVCNLSASGVRHVLLGGVHAGGVLPIDLGTAVRSLLCVPESFLCAGAGVSLGQAFDRRLNVSVPGMDHMGLLNLTGDGAVLLRVSGDLIERRLESGQTWRVECSSLVALEGSVRYEVQVAAGVKSSLLEGGGVGFVTLTGPGRIWIQSLGMTRFRGWSAEAVLTKNVARRS